MVCVRNMLVLSRVVPPSMAANAVDRASPVAVSSSTTNCLHALMPWSDSAAALWPSLPSLPSLPSRLSEDAERCIAGVRRYNGDRS